MLRAFEIQPAATGGRSPSSAVRAQRAWGFSLLSSLSPGTAAAEARVTPWQGVSYVLAPLVLTTTHSSDEETKAWGKATHPPKFQSRPIIELEFDPCGHGPPRHSNTPEKRMPTNPETRGPNSFCLSVPQHPALHWCQQGTQSHRPDPRGCPRCFTGCRIG